MKEGKIWLNRYEVRDDVGRRQIIQGLLEHAEESNFFSFPKCRGKPVEDFVQDSDMV